MRTADERLLAAQQEHRAASENYAVECCCICRYVRPATVTPNRLVCRRYAPRSEWGVVDKKLSVPLVNADDWCGEFDGRPAPNPVSQEPRP